MSAGTAQGAPRLGAAGEVVMQMLQAWRRLDLDALMACVAKDAVFRPNPGGEEVRGYDAIRTLWSRYMDLFAAYSFEVRAMLSSENMVFMERVETVDRVDGQRIVIPVAAVFEIDDEGKLRQWRDYWDPAVAKPPARASPA